MERKECVELYSEQYTLILYPKIRDYGEKINPLREYYINRSYIVINEEEWYKSNWLYEIVLERVDKVTSKKGKVRYEKTRTVLDRVRLCDSMKSC
jgi:hypothetical protein